jgi:phenylpropionate dioxygenase-like ring-hydroxylating dioxygenase large terminal subunit
MPSPNKAHTPLCDLLAAYQPGHALPRDFYKSPEVYQAELTGIFHKHWMFAGHTSQIPKVGDYFLFNFDSESIIIVQSEDGVKAHLNVCRHRGSHICTEKHGTAKALVCPYHAWTYGLDGSLLGARQMPDGFDKKAHSLRPVHVALVGGLIFISLADKPLSLAPMFTALSGVFDLFGFDHMRLAHQQSYSINANWKLAVENYQECYHCAPSHPEFAQIHAMAGSPEKFKAERARYLESIKSTAANKVKCTEANAYFDLASPGVEGFQYGRNPLVAGALTGSKGGNPLAPLLGKLTAFDGGASEFMLGPLSFFLIYDDHMVGYRFTPTGLDTCVCDVFWFVREDAAEGTDYDRASLTWLWHITTQADERIITANKKGVNSRYYTPGPLSKMEYFEQHFLNWYLAALRRR